MHRDIDEMRFKKDSIIISKFPSCRKRPGTACGISTSPFHIIPYHSGSNGAVMLLMMPIFRAGSSCFYLFGISIRGQLF
jgi:hypothetical protein